LKERRKQELPRGLDIFIETLKYESFLLHTIYLSYNINNQCEINHSHLNF